MPTTDAYLLDANVFIEAKRRYYAFDICPGFWDALLLQQSLAKVASIDRVKTEIERGKDDLTEWLNDIMPEMFFVKSNEPDVIIWFTQIMSWIQNQEQFSAEAISEFAGSSDGWLIAFAKAHTMILVTHEVLAPEAKKKIPIPNVCVAFSVRNADTFEMLRALETRFLLQK